jgi:hypothetical protein
MVSLRVRNREANVNTALRGPLGFHTAARSTRFVNCCAGNFLKHNLDYAIPFVYYYYYFFLSLADY